MLYFKYKGWGPGEHAIKLIPSNFDILHALSALLRMSPMALGGLYRVAFFFFNLKCMYRNVQYSFIWLAFLKFFAAQLSQKKPASFD